MTDEPMPVPTPPAHSWTALTDAGRLVLDAVAADPDGTLLALDFDGTLSPIVEDPTASTMVEQSRAALARIDGQLAATAIVSGREVAAVRRMSEVDQRPGLEHLVILGQYGVERYDAASGALRDPEIDPAVRRAKGRLEELVARAGREEQAVQGSWVEDKGRAVAAHTRRAEDPARAFEVLAPRVHELAEELGLICEDGRNVIELKAVSTSKAEALTELIEEVEPRVVLMCGDDLGDLPAMRVVAEWIASGRPGARVVSASPEQPEVARHADVLCDQTVGVAAFLRDLANRVDATW